MNINIVKRSGAKEPLDILKIRKMTDEAIEGLTGVSQSELELDAQIKFIDGMSSSDIQDALIKTAVEKIDIDVPNWTFVAARLFIFDLYHKVGRIVGGVKGKKYCHLRTYLDNTIGINNISNSILTIVVINFKPETVAAFADGFCFKTNNWEFGFSELDVYIFVWCKFIEFGAVYQIFYSPCNSVSHNRIGPIVSNENGNPISIFIDESFSS